MKIPFPLFQTEDSEQRRIDENNEAFLNRVPPDLSGSVRMARIAADEVRIDRATVEENSRVEGIAVERGFESVDQFGSIVDNLRINDPVIGSMFTEWAMRGGSAAELREIADIQARMEGSQ